MRCEACQGRGLISVPHIPSLGLYSTTPCRACGGTGVAHCCDGPVGGPDDVPPDVALSEKTPSEGD